jgi:PAS domain S-box-containing protein
MKVWPLKVLMIYECAENRDLAFRLLRQSDIGPVQLDSIKPLQLSRTKPVLRAPDVCIVDSQADRMTLFARIRAIGINAPIVVLTTDSGSDVLDALHHGAADCLIKSQLTAASFEESICAVMDHARALKSQAQSERLYLSLVENTTDLIYTHDLSGNCTSVNKIGEEALGYLQEEILTMNFQQIIAPEYVTAFRRTIERLVECRKPDRVELALIARDQQRVLVAVTCHLIYQDGTPIGVQGVGKLVTRGLRPAELPSSEARY